MSLSRVCVYVAPERFPVFRNFPVYTSGKSNAPRAPRALRAAPPCAARFHVIKRRGKTSHDYAISS